MAEINLMDQYPKSRRPVLARGKLKLARKGRIHLDRASFDTDDILFEQHLLSAARRFGRQYFDGDRLFGYGGYYYHPRFWSGTVKRLSDHYRLDGSSSVLDVGCAKGFLLHDFRRLIPGLTVAGVDISEYAKAHAIEEIRPLITTADAVSLPFPDGSFDLVISVNTVHNLPLEECKKAIMEIQRVTRRGAFIVVNAWRDERERERLMKWNITALTYMQIDEWRKLFEDVGYRGDYDWFFVE